MKIENFPTELINKSITVIAVFVFFDLCFSLIFSIFSL